LFFEGSAAVTGRLTAAYIPITIMSKKVQRKNTKSVITLGYEKV